MDKFHVWIKISQKRIFFHLELSLPGDLNFVVEWQQQYYLVSSCRPPWLLTYDKVAYNTTKFKTISGEELLLNSPQSSAKAHPYCREASFDSLHSVFWSTNALHITYERLFKHTPANMQTGVSEDSFILLRILFKRNTAILFPCSVCHRRDFSQLRDSAYALHWRQAE